MDWFNGKSELETKDVPIRYGFFTVKFRLNQSIESKFYHVLPLEVKFLREDFAGLASCASLVSLGAAARAS